MRKIVLIFFAYLFVTFQLDSSMWIILPPIHPEIPWNVLPTFAFTTPLLKGFEILATFYINFVIYVLAVGNGMLALGINQILFVYALLCGLDFIKRLHAEVANSSDGAAKLHKVLLAYKSLTILTIQYNSIHRIWLMCPLLLLCGGLFTMSAYLVIIHNRDMSMISTMIFVGCMIVCTFIQAVSYRIPGAVFTQ